MVQKPLIDVNKHLEVVCLDRVEIESLILHRLIERMFLDEQD